MKKVIQYTFFPLTLSLVLGSVFIGVRLISPQNFVFIPGIISLLLIVIFLFFEKLIPYNKEWLKGRGDTLTDGIQTLFVLPAASKMAELFLPILVYYPLIWISQSNYSFSILQNNAILSFVLLLLACEFCYYWIHRAFHTFSWMWKFHAVHHGAKRVYWLNAGRFHFIEAFVSSLIYFLPIPFFAPEPELIVMLIVLSAITGFIEHVNIDFKAGILNYVFNTAQLHRWHHSIIISESNKNYGKVLVIWDIIFRTFYLPKNRNVDEVGIVEDNVPNSFLGQLKYPFRK